MNPIGIDPGEYARQREAGNVPCPACGHAKYQHYPESVESFAGCWTNGCKCGLTFPSATPLPALPTLAEMESRGDIKIRRDGTVDFEFWYPRDETSVVRAIEVGLCDVRAADSIRIEYDFGRDGYSIKQASTFRWEADDTVRDPDWQEVAFIQAWAREKPGTGAP